MDRPETVDEPQALVLNTSPQKVVNFGSADAAAIWLVDNLDEVGSHFMEAVESGSVSESVVVAFANLVARDLDTHEPDADRANLRWWLESLEEAASSGSYGEPVLAAISGARDAAITARRQDGPTSARKQDADVITLGEESLRNGALAYSEDDDPDAEMDEQVGRFGKIGLREGPF